jgi:hypothetical protein
MAMQTIRDAKPKPRTGSSTISHHVLDKTFLVQLDLVDPVVPYSLSQLAGHDMSALRL